MDAQINPWFLALDSKLKYMKYIILTHFILFLFALLACSSNSSKQDVSEENDSIPEGAIPFEYDFKLKKAILIPGTLDDTIPLRFWLETGSGAVVFSDSLTGESEEEIKAGKYNTKVNKPMTIKIGEWVQTYGDGIDAYYLDKNHYAFDWLGSDIAFIPWDFFDKKIMEISFTKQYIRELSNTKDLTGYDSVKILVENNLLGIPSTVMLQDKTIKENLTLDTGFNGTVSFDNSIVSKYNMVPDSAYFGKSHGTSGLNKAFSYSADTIIVGSNIVTKDYSIGFSLEKQRKYPFSGLIGNKFLDNFDIVLDLKNYCLYLKPRTEGETNDNL